MRTEIFGVKLERRKLLLAGAPVTPPGAPKEGAIRPGRTCEHRL